MKRLIEFINEAVKPQFLDSLYNQLNIVGQLPNKVANVLAQFRLYEIEDDKPIELIVDSEKKILIFKNLSVIDTSINRWDKLINTGYGIAFNENTNICIGSGMSKEQSREWPTLSYGGWRLKNNWRNILRYLVKSNPEYKFNRIIIERHKLDGDYFPTDTFSKIGAYINEIKFYDCVGETNFSLPNDDDKKKWPNPNMKFSSTSKRAATYFAENNMLVGTEEEVKAHWTKSFAKEMEEKQRQEAARQERIKPTHDNPPVIYTFDNGWMDVKIETNKEGTKACLEFQFSKGAAGTYREKSYWDDHTDLVWLKGAYVEVEGKIWEITKITCEGGYWTSGRNIYDFYLKRIY